MVQKSNPKSEDELQLKGNLQGKFVLSLKEQCQKRKEEKKPCLKHSTQRQKDQKKVNKKRNWQHNAGGNREFRGRINRWRVK